MKLQARSAGVLLHITALPGPHGSGDFGPDAYAFVDWLAAAGQSLWQVLPVNPIGPGNSPYQSPSAFAGSPFMVALQPLVECGWLAAPVLPAGGFDLHKLDFERVHLWRMGLLRQAAAGFFARATKAERLAFNDWTASQASWLLDYGWFMALHTLHNGQPWWTWSAPLREREPAALRGVQAEHAAEVAFWHFVQWCFDKQLAALKTYANQRGVALIGDLPIFIAHHSADCWARPDLFELDAAGQPTVVAGVPPDELGPDGQRWGNPLYRWQRMADEDFAWWAARLQRAFTQADTVRIDHFLGFCNHWEIPAASAGAKVGRWAPGPGQALFDSLQRQLGPLPIIAEDLGLITPAVVALRDACGFPGMKILQFAFGGGLPDDAVGDVASEGTHEFLPHNYQPNVVVYSGTHDNDTARGWWNNAPAVERARAALYLACGAEDLHTAMIRAACNSVAQMAVFPLQDVLGLPSAQRFNLPGTVSAENWSWRFEWAALTTDLTRQLAAITRASGRDQRPLSI